MTARSLKRKKMSSQFVLVNLCAIFPIILLINVVMLVSFNRQLHDSAVDAMLDKSYNAQLYAMGFFSKNMETDTAVYLQKIAPYIASYMADSAGVEVEVFTRNGMLASSARKKEPEFISQDVHNAFENKSYMFVARKGEVVLSFSSPIYTANADTVGVIRFLYPMTNQYGQLLQMAVILVGLTAIALVLIFVVGFLLTHEITRPLYMLRDKVNRMKDGDLNQRIPPVDNAEIDELGSAFNLMCERLNEYITILGNQQRQLRQIFNSTTHQLKTPLTSIIGYSQMIQLNSDNDQVCEDAFIIEEAGETLLRSITAMLEESRSQTMWYPLQTSTFLLYEMIEESINLLKPRLVKYNITVVNNIEKELELTTDRNLAQEVVLALLDNAIVHSGCSEIHFMCSLEKDGMLCLYAVDNGQGISDDDAPYVFKAFYRNTESTTSGNGLGLAVCENFMRRLGGSIRLNRGGKWSTEFILEFPCNNI